ncbi:hypothetical protein [Bacteroides caecimuris]|uniref:hypothetical protein n=1 Tax=Bacteroides caecimuris TaxID=1796613 RepID=UPI00242DDC12|nr:hypothetical protein [Bacteroides caecimuris]
MIFSLYFKKNKIQYLYLFIETWSKEDELKALNAQHLELEHKIAADLALKHEQPMQAEEVEQDTPKIIPAISWYLLVKQPTIKSQWWRTGNKLRQCKLFKASFSLNI